MLRFNDNTEPFKQKTFKDRFVDLFRKEPLSPLSESQPRSFGQKVGDLFNPPQELISPVPKIQTDVVPKAMAVEEAVKPTPIPKNKLARNPAVVDYNITDEVKNAILKAADKYKIPSTLLFDIALQESSFEKDKVNPETKKHIGLYQFDPPTWSNMIRWGAVPENADRFDPVANAEAAAWAIKHGYLKKWRKSKDVWEKFYSPEELEDYYLKGH